MSYFAKVLDGQVKQTIVATREYMENRFVDDSPGHWIEYFKDGGSRVNPASIGGTYNSEHDVFINPKPYESWILNETTWEWECPVALPEDGLEVPYIWNEETQSWDAVETE